MKIMNSVGIIPEYQGFIFCFAKDLEDLERGADLQPQKGHPSDSKVPCPFEHRVDIWRERAEDNRDAEQRIDAREQAAHLRYWCEVAISDRR